MDWHGVLALEGVPTKDGRLLEPDALEWARMPLPLLAIENATTKGNAGARIVGRIDRIFREGDEIRAEGIIDTESDVLDVLGELAGKRKVLGGIDVDDMLAEYTEDNMMVFNHARIRGFTLYLGSSRTRRGPAFGHSTWIQEGTWDSVPVSSISSATSATSGASATPSAAPPQPVKKKKAKKS